MVEGSRQAGDTSECLNFVWFEAGRCSSSDPSRRHKHSAQRDQPQGQTVILSKWLSPGCLLQMCTEGQAGRGM